MLACICYPPLGPIQTSSTYTKEHHGWTRHLKNRAGLLTITFSSRIFRSIAENAAWISCYWFARYLEIAFWRLEQTSIHLVHIVRYLDIANVGTQLEKRSCKLIPMLGTQLEKRSCKLSISLFFSFSPNLRTDRKIGLFNYIFRLPL